MIDQAKKDVLIKGFAEVINMVSAENESDTPDFIIAEYLFHCLEAFNQASNRRTAWYLSER